MIKQMVVFDSYRLDKQTDSKKQKLNTFEPLLQILSFYKSLSLDWFSMTQKIVMGGSLAQPAWHPAGKGSKGLGVSNEFQGRFATKMVGQKSAAFLLDFPAKHGILT
jgi:hypothetical protein